jgi:two-component system NtrC family sensor kinase
VDSLSNLYHNLNANRLNIKQIPFVIQYNKRDLPDAMPVGVMNRRLNFRSVPYFESVAFKGVGVVDTFLSIARETVGTTFRKYHLDKKIRDFDSMLTLIESNIRTNMHEMPVEQEPQEEQPFPMQDSTVLRLSGVSVSDLQTGKPADAQDLLEDALKSNMETARLYSELKQVKETLEKKNEELNQLYAHLERANQDNLKTRRYLEGLIQSVGEAIISFSADGRILTWNASAEHIFGFARAEIVGHTLHQLTPPSRAGELEQAIAQVSKGQIIRDVPTTRLRKDGSEFPARITYAPIRGGDDRVLAFSALVRDLGEQAKLEQRIQDVEVNSALATILPPLYNDVLNRLTALILNRGLLMAEARDPEQEARMQKFLHSAEMVQTLLRPLLMVMSPSSPRRVPCHLNQLVQDAARRVEPEAAAAGVTMDYTLDPGLVECAMDPEQMAEAISCMMRNGVFNACRSPMKRLRVGTRRVDRTLHLVCQDSGPAIAEAKRAGIFDMKEVNDIDSLGLCVVANVAKGHGGRISVRSQEGVGNAFLLELPMMEVNPAPSPVVLAGKKILVVDDEDFLLECLADAISTWGCKVTPCSLAAEAIQKLQNDTYELIISDIRMPGLTGIQLFDWIKEHQPEMASRILYTTGDSYDPETKAFLEGSSLPHLGKPFDLKKLRQAIEEILAAIVA